MKEKEVLFWSIAFPGFGQILNEKFIKAILFILLELIINIKGNFNEIIILSFQGETKKAILQANYEWLMFYPCLYFFSAWDAYKDAGGGKNNSFFPFVFCAYFVTLSLIYSSKFPLFGPVWLSMVGVIPGILVGFLMKRKTKNIP